MKKHRIVISLIIILIFYCMGIGTSISYAEPKKKEYHIKAAFLLNFAKFTEWPPHVFSETSSSLTLYILGKDPFDEALKTIEDKIVKGRKLVVRKASCIEDIKECHILFISTSEKKNLSEILTKIKDKPILTVAETKNFCQSGGTVNFIVVKNKVHFEINVDAAKRTGLKISSKLLKLSAIIKER
ncbi:MAG: YfiR family protein [Planctomycetota bacterium]